MVNEESRWLEVSGSVWVSPSCKKQNLIACHLALRANWIEVKCADPRCDLFGKTSAAVEIAIHCAVACRKQEQAKVTGSNAWISRKANRIVRHVKVKEVWSATWGVVSDDFCLQPN